MQFSFLALAYKVVYKTVEHTFCIKWAINVLEQKKLASVTEVNASQMFYTPPAYIYHVRNNGIMFQ